MIVVFEQDIRVRKGSRFNWKPIWFKDRFGGQVMWRFGWIMWSLSYYGSPGLRDFFDHVERTEWRGAQ